MPRILRNPTDKAPEQPSPTRGARGRTPSALDRWIQRYLDHLVLVAGRSANTMLGYRRDLARYAAFCAERVITDPRAVDSQFVGEFLVSQTRSGLSPASVARALSAVKSFHRYLLQHEVCPQNPARAVRTPRLPRKLPDVLSVRQMQMLLDAPPVGDPYAVRDRAIMALLYGCGLRVSEAANLGLDDIDFETRFVRVRGKGNRERLVPFGEITASAIHAYLQWPRRRDDEGNETGLLFLSRRHAGFSRMGLWLVVRKAALRVGLAERVSPHTFRHSFATHLVEAGADLRAVQMMLGHRSVSTTQIYTHLDRGHLRRVHEQFHPLEAPASRSRG